MSWRSAEQRFARPENAGDWDADVVEVGRTVLTETIKRSDCYLELYEGRSFAYAGRSNWNSLPAYLRDSSLSLSSFKRHLKTFLFSFY